MKKIMLSLAVSLIIVSCNNGDRSSNSIKSDIDTVKHSDTFNGVFTGTTPCADCPGIYTVIGFSPDHDYFENLKYLDRDAHFADTGVWKVKDSLITVSFKNDHQSRYFKIVNDSIVRMLDSDKKVITGPIADFFILKRKDTTIQR